MSDTVPGLRQRKKDRLRAQLIDTAISLFLARGYAETTIDEITAAIDVSPRTFFRYFATKDDVFAAGPFQVGHGLTEFVASAPASLTPVDVSREALRLIASRYDAMPDALALGRMITQTPELRRRLAITREQWARDIAAGLLSRMPDTDDAPFRALVIAGSVQLILSASFERWVEEGGRRPLTEILEDGLRIAADAHAETMVAA
jgi:AcrR family transcriptional regulator